MEGWVKIGVQRASVLYPNACYNEPCYIEVQVYLSVHYDKAPFRHRQTVKAELITTGFGSTGSVETMSLGEMGPNL